VENELLVLNTEEVYESENLNYDELEELLDEVISKDISLEAHFNSSLYPFDFSSNEKFFFKELKALLYRKHL